MHQRALVPKVRLGVPATNLIPTTTESGSPHQLNPIKFSNVIMDSSHNLQHTPSASRDINDIIEQYSSPAPSSSPAVRARQPYDSSPAYGRRPDVSMSSSPPPYTPSLLKQSISRHHHNMTNSGYLDRAQLFGRTSASGLQSSPSPLPEAPRNTVDHKRNNRLSLRMLDGMGTVYSSPSSALSSLGTKHSSFSSMREKFSQAPPDEWMEAGTPEREAGDHSGSLDYPAWSARGGLVPTEDGSLSCTPSVNGKSRKTVTDDGASTKSNKSGRKVSQAEMALREVMATHKPASKPAHAVSKSAHGRRKSWADRIFNRRGPEYVLATPERAESVSTEEDPIEFSYVAPEVTSESPRDILARAEAREAAEKEHIVKTEGTADHDDAEVQVLDGGYIDIQRPHRTTSTSIRTSSRVSSAFSRVESWVSARSEALDDLKAEDAFSYQSTDCNQKDQNASETTEIAPVQAQPSGSSLSLIVTTMDQVPVLRGHRRPSLAQTIMIFSQELQSKRQGPLAMSPISTIMIQNPTVATPNCGLSFSTASAVVYGCMVFAAMRRVLLGLGADISPLHLALDLNASFWFAICVCMVLHLLLGGQLEQAPGDMARVLGTGVGRTYASLVDGFWQGSGQQGFW
jgi:hypothetical protein